VSLTRRLASCNRRPESINTIPSSFFFLPAIAFAVGRTAALSFCRLRVGAVHVGGSGSGPLLGDKSDTLIGSTCQFCRPTCRHVGRICCRQVGGDYSSESISILLQFDGYATVQRPTLRPKCVTDIHLLLLLLLFFFASVGMIPREFKIRRIYKSGYDHQTVQSMTGNKTALKRCTGTEQR